MSTRKETSQDPLRQGLAKLFNSTEHSDLEIHIGKATLPAHAIVLATQSTYFSNALKSDFLEARDRKFNFQDGSPHAHWRSFQYLYTGDYQDEPCENLDFEEDDPELLKHVRVYMLADYFAIKELEDLAHKKFEAQLGTLWRSETLPDCIREIYGYTVVENRLKKTLLHIIQKNIQELWNSGRFRATVRESGDFAVDLLSQRISNLEC